MKARRTTALMAMIISAGNPPVLKSVGWYLMTPPPVVDSNGIPLVGPNVKAPLSQWQQDEPQDNTTGMPFDTFASRAACEDYRGRLVASARDELSSAPRGIERQPAMARFVRWTYMLAAADAQCIASDDPRLNEK